MTSGLAKEELQEAVGLMLKALEEIVHLLAPVLDTSTEHTLSRELRLKLLTLAGEADDYILWIENTDKGYIAHEIETGISGDPSNNPIEALKSYFKPDKAK